MLRIVTVIFKNYSDLDGFYLSLCSKIHVPCELVVWDNSPESLHSNRPHLKGKIPVFFLGDGKNYGFGAGINNCCFKEDLNSAPLRPNSFLILNPDTLLLDDIDSQKLNRWNQLKALIGLGVYSDPNKSQRQASARRFPSIITSLTHRAGILTRLWPQNPWSKKYLGHDLDSKSLQRVDWVSGCAIYTPADIFWELKGFDPNFFLYVEDVDLGRKACSLNIPVLFDPSISVFHKGATTSKSAPIKSDWYHHKGMLRYSWKWSGGIGKLFWPITSVGILVRFFIRVGLRRVGEL